MPAAEKDQVAWQPRKIKGVFSWRAQPRKIKSRGRRKNVAAEKDQVTWQVRKIKGVCFWRAEPRKIKSRGPRKKVAGEKDKVTWQPCKIKGLLFVCGAEKDQVKRPKGEGAGKDQVTWMANEGR